MNQLVHRLFVVRAVVFRRTHARADGQPYQQIDDEIDERARRAHRGERRFVGGVAHYDQIRRVEKQLQQTRRYDGQGVNYNPLEQRSLCQIDGGGNALPFFLRVRNKNLFPFKDYFTKFILALTISKSNYATIGIVKM